MAGAAGRAAQLSAEWKEGQRAAGIVNGRSYGRWDEHGSWIRGDPGKRRPFSGAADDAAAVASEELPAAERLARSGAEAAVNAYVRRTLRLDREHPTTADLQRVCPRKPPPEDWTDTELIEAIFETRPLLAPY